MNAPLPNRISGSGSCRTLLPRPRKPAGGGPPPSPSPAPLSAYQKGVQDFYGRDYIITPDVLIPRPETEQMIDAVLSLAGKPYLPGVKPTERQVPEKPVIYDVGTGSGCIAITLKKELPEAEIVATDISEKALEVTKKNAELHNVHITTIISHLLQNVKHKHLPTPNIIVANLPYVDENWDWLDKEALSAEPSIALYAEDGGLELIKELIIQSAELAVPYLLLEADPSQHAQITAFAKKNKYELYETRGFILGYKYLIS